MGGIRRICHGMLSGKQLHYPVEALGSLLPFNASLATCPHHTTWDRRWGGGRKLLKVTLGQVGSHEMCRQQQFMQNTTKRLPAPNSADSTTKAKQPNLQYNHIYIEVCHSIPWCMSCPMQIGILLELRRYGINDACLFARPGSDFECICKSKG